MMTEVNLTVLILMMRLVTVYSGRLPVAGVYDPFADQNRDETNEPTAKDESQTIANQPSLDSIHDHVHQPSDTNKTESGSDQNDRPLEKAGPSLDLIDSHPHDVHSSPAVDIAKRPLIQPSIDFLDAQLHGGDEHVHDKNQTESKSAADLNDFRRWLQEQNQTSQLNRFLSLQKEVKQYHLDDTNQLNDKLNRTIEEIRSTVSTKLRTRHDL